LSQKFAGPLDYDNAFWRFSLAVYGRPGVAKECLALQDAHGIDVNILLFCAWLGTQSIPLKREDIEAVSQAVAGWHDDIVRPLRTVRQRLKDFTDGEKLRAGIKDAEIKAEQIEQAMLFAFSRRLQRGDAAQGDCVAGNVRQYIDMTAPGAAAQVSAKASANHLVDAARRMP
jgi:uncharacterized protein (TIGR02444 family)